MTITELIHRSHYTTKTMTNSKNNKPWETGALNFLSFQADFLNVLFSTKYMHPKKDKNMVCIEGKAVNRIWTWEVPDSKERWRF
jgi:hypothetical protein